MKKRTYATTLDAQIAHARKVADAAARRAARAAAADHAPRVLTRAQRDAHAWMRASDLGRTVYLLVCDQYAQHDRLAASACMYRLDPADPPYTQYVYTVGPDGLRQFDPPEPLPLPHGLRPLGTSGSSCTYCQVGMSPALHYRPKTRRKPGRPRKQAPARKPTPHTRPPATVVPRDTSGSLLLRYGMGVMIDWSNTAPIDPYAPAPKRGDVPASAAVELLLSPPAPVDSQPAPWPVRWVCAGHATLARKQADRQRRADYTALGLSDTRRQRLHQYRQHLATTAYLPPNLTERVAHAWAREDAGEAQVVELVERFRALTSPPANACHLHAGCAAILDALAADGLDVYALPDDITAGRDMIG